jgi:hypothetical protein
MRTAVASSESDSVEKLRAELQKRIRRRAKILERLLEETESHPWGIEDCFYRFYHSSFKVYLLQDFTARMATEFEKLLPGRPLNSRFLEMISTGTGKKFHISHNKNKNWAKHTRPILEAFFHAQYLLKMICKYGPKAENGTCDSGWLAVLYLYRLR